MNSSQKPVVFNFVHQSGISHISQEEKKRNTLFSPFPNLLGYKSVKKRVDYVPKLALNPGVSRPAAAGSPAGAYDEKAAKDGLRVLAKESQKVPKVPKTTAGNVLPRIHSRSAPRVMRMPP